ncbi:class I SAM-dependent methyltransferase [Haloplasma contractile]|uniref:UbiE-COQ5 methyltransferase protein n=1 Tax=Haloplasma contractile SSD-17B TaxID=1033810 RepID=F7PVF6_9MOLU|nr:methyltransferase domain-containing protein [Haloplasma contractile]ERJ12878.1 UbiE-COQ5 methyltransferase protein [Haloplasma contractile SSD-17B]
MDFSIKKLKEIGSKISDKEVKSVLERIEIKPGQTVMDLGAGAGIYTLAIADAIGKDGHVYSVDTRKEILAYIESQATDKGFNNITYIEAESPIYDINQSSLDIIFTRNVLHHLPAAIDYITRLNDYLKDEGLLVLIDHSKGANIPGHSDDDFYTVDLVKELGINAGYSFYKTFDVKKNKLFVILKK